MIIDLDVVESNLAAMERYCRDAGVSLAPHAKTTLAPELVRRHLAHGAWAMTAALPRQVRGLHALGVPRILLANELVDASAIAWVAEHLLAPDGPEFWCYADSVAGADRLSAGSAGASRPLSVLVEAGYPGGRTGTRDRACALAVARAVAASPHLRLAGVAGYEGLLPLDEVDEFLDRLHGDVLALRDLFEVDRPIVTAGGSSYFDCVVARLGPSRFDFPVRTVLRSGCYAVHDHGLYARTAPRGPGVPRLVPALELRASVLSVPEPGLALVAFGRREAPTDDILPVVLGRDDLTVTAVNDHHAYVRGAGASSLSPGDVLRFGISHPCGVFDRWRTLTTTAGATIHTDLAGTVTA